MSQTKIKKTTYVGISTAGALLVINNNNNNSASSLIVTYARENYWNNLLVFSLLAWIHFGRLCAHARKAVSRINTF